MRININDYSNIAISEAIRQMSDNYHISPKNLADMVNSSERTIFNYQEKSGERQRENSIPFRIHILFGTLQSISRHVKDSEMVLKLLNEKVKELDNQSVIDLIRSSETSDKSLTYALNLFLQSQIDGLTDKLRPAIEEFRKQFGHFNEQSLEKAAVESPILLERLYADNSLQPISRALALEHLQFSREKNYLRLMQQALETEKSPFIREGAIRGIVGLCSVTSQEPEEIIQYLSERREMESSEGVLTTFDWAKAEIEFILRFGI